MLISKEGIGNPSPTLCSPKLCQRTSARVPLPATPSHVPSLSHSLLPSLDPSFLGQHDSKCEVLRTFSSCNRAWRGEVQGTVDPLGPLSVSDKPLMCHSREKDGQEPSLLIVGQERLIGNPTPKGHWAMRTDC